MILLIDNGHGIETPGKRSPDGRLLEYKWAREVAQLIADKANAEGIQTRMITPEENDVSLGERTRRVNGYCHRYGAKNCVLISIHVNAAGSGREWKNASGFSAWVAPNASANSKRLAKILWQHFNRAGLRGNRVIALGYYWTGNFAICRDTKCVAVLTENLFQDNKEEVNYLLSPIGKDKIASLHISALLEYLKSEK